MQRVDKEYLDKIRSGKLRKIGMVVYSVIKDDFICFNNSKKEHMTVTLFNSLDTILPYCKTIEEELVKSKESPDNERFTHMLFLCANFWVLKDDIPNVVPDQGYVLQIPIDDVEEIDYVNPCYEIKLGFDPSVAMVGDEL